MWVRPHEQKYRILGDYQGHVFWVAKLFVEFIPKVFKDLGILNICIEGMAEML